VVDQVGLEEACSERVNVALELPEVARYLLARATLSARALVDEGLVVRDVSSRHRNFRVEIPGGGGGVQLKQGNSPDTQLTVAREARVYQELKTLDARFTDLIPKVHDYDAERGILITELISDAEDLRAQQIRTGTFRADIGASIGEALALLHGCAPPDVEAGVSCPLPPFLGIYQPTLEIFRNASVANLQLIRIVQASTELRAHLSRVKANLRREALLHNDIRWDNFLITEQGLKLVDWEAAAYGDPAWDLGSVLGQYLSSWVFSIPVTGSEAVANYAQLARLPLAALKAACNACWTAYFVTRQMASAPAAQFLLRAVSMAAVRLLQSAYESSQFSVQLTSCEILHVQLATNILARPAAACSQLMGLPMRETQ
jgi:Predicted choline kinase involved in LPS biosynthesis